MPTGPQDVTIRIQGKRATGYPVHASLADGGVFAGDDLVVPVSELLTLELDANAYGMLLGQRLFSPPILRALERAAADTSGGGETKLRVRLCISREAGELHSLAWERVFLTWQGQLTPISASGSLVFSRFLELELPEEDPLESRPLRLAVAIANPSQLPAGMYPIEVEKELARLAGAFSSIPDLAFSVLPGRTPIGVEVKQTLQAAGISLIPGATTLARLVDLASHCDVLHVLSHGAWNRQGAETESCAKLFLEDEEGGFAKATDTDLAARIADLPSRPRVLFLAACDSAASGGATAGAQNPVAPPVGLGPKMVAAGIPAVVAMQREVDMETAGQLAAKFYAHLLDHGEVDLALSEARLSLYQASTPEWAIPVMFLRIRGGRLFSPDPIHTALRGVAAAYPPKPDSEYIPIEAACLNTPDLIRDWERASNESVSSVDLWSALLNFATGAGPMARRVFALIGDSGTGKTLHLEHLAGVLASSAERAGPARVLPVYVDLRAYHDTATVYGSKLEELIFQSIVRLTASFPRAAFDSVLALGQSARFCLLFDGADALADDARLEIFQAISALSEQHPQHRYILAIDCRYFDPASWAPSELLVIRLLSPRVVERFLRQDRRPPSADLLNQIIEVNLFDIATIPWLLLFMRQMALRGAVLRSRSAVLSSVVEQRLITIGAERGLRSRARKSLLALAWLLHSSNREKVALDEAFGVFRRVQDARDYSLESLLQDLVDCGLLVLGQPETVRFAYPALQHVCAARSLSDDPSAELGRITDTLGRSERMRWWEPVLVLYSSMAANPLPLFESILWGGSLTQGEQLFLLCRCLLEVSWRVDGPAGSQFAASPYFAMSDQICSALQWRARRVNESSWMVRRQAVQALGRWRRSGAIPFLCDVALKPVPTRGKEPAFEYSQIRIAAARALRRVAERTSELAAADPAVPPLLTAWLVGDVESLKTMLTSAAPGVQGVAAFALGDIGDLASQQALFTAFSAEKTDPATLWAIADAFLEMEPAPVLGEFKRLIEVANTQWRPANAPRVALYERLLYLLGELRTDFPEARGFIESFLNQPTLVVLKGRAMIALGKLRASDWLPVWEEVASGTVAKIHVDPAPSPAQLLFLRRKAIEAIGEMGSLESLISIRRRQAWDADLDESLFWATERTVTTTGARWRRYVQGGEKYDGANRLFPGRF